VQVHGELKSFVQR